MRMWRTIAGIGLAVGTAQMWAQAPPLPPGTTDAEQAGQDKAQGQGQTGPLGEAEAAIDAKDYDKARGLLDTYLSAHANDARALFDRGFCDDAQGHDDKAKGYYQRAIAADPKQFEARMALGLILAGEGSPDAAEQLETATTLEPNPPNPAAKAQAYRALARLVRTSDPDKAKAALLEALKISPETVGDTLLTAEIADAEGDKDVAEEAYKRVLGIDPQSSPAVAGLTHLLLAEKKYAEAEPLLKAALVRDPDDPALNTQYAALLAAQGKLDEAVGALEKLHQQEPQDRGIAMMLADAYAGGQDYEKADAVYANLLAASPNDAELMSARGQILIREQKYAEALGLLQRAVKIRPEDADAWSGIAFAASETHQYEVELDALTMRSKYAAETSATYFLWATASDNLHHKKQAVEYYHLFLNSSQGKFPDEEWQAKQRLALLEK